MKLKLKKLKKIISTKDIVNSKILNRPTFELLQKKLATKKLRVKVYSIISPSRYITLTPAYIYFLNQFYPKVLKGLPRKEEMIASYSGTEDILSSYVRLIKKKPKNFLFIYPPQLLYQIWIATIGNSKLENIISRKQINTENATQVFFDMIRRDTDARIIKFDYYWPDAATSKKILNDTNDRFTPDLYSYFKQVPRWVLFAITQIIVEDIYFYFKEQEIIELRRNINYKDWINETTTSFDSVLEHWLIPEKNNKQNDLSFDNLKFLTEIINSKGGYTNAIAEFINSHYYSLAEELIKEEFIKICKNKNCLSVFWEWLKNQKDGKSFFSETLGILDKSKIKKHRKEYRKLLGQFKKELNLKEYSSVFTRYKSLFEYHNAGEESIAEANWKRKKYCCPNCEIAAKNRRYYNKLKHTT